MIKKIRLILSSLSPIFAKRIFRIFYELFLPYKKIEKTYSNLNLDQELIQNCLFCETRRSMLDFLPPQAVVAELGTDRGIFAKQIIERTSPSQLYLCDINFSMFNDQNILGSDSVYKYEGTTLEFLKTFPADFFDWIYIDAGHSYIDVLSDIKLAKDKVKPGGFLVFNDYAHIHPTLGRYGVMQAVTEFINEERWEVKLFAFNPAALYDIAIQRPNLK